MATFNVVVALLVLVVVLAVVYCWSLNTTSMINEAIVAQYVDNEVSSENVIEVTNLSDLNGLSLAEIEGEVEVMKPRRGKKNISSAETDGAWGRMGRSHYGKGRTLHSYRTGEKRCKKALHPCMEGGSTLD